MRTLAAYLDAIGVDVQVPAPKTVPVGPCRATPYIYSQQDLNALLEACEHAFTRPLVVATIRTVIGLLAATGMRIGGALRLTVPDIDTTSGVLTIRGNKLGPDRLIPIHPRDQQRRGPRTATVIRPGRRP